MKFGDELGTLASHVERAKNSSDRTQSRYGKLAGKIDNLGELEGPEKRKKLK